MTKKEDDPRENLTLPRQVPTRMANYEVTYLKDSAGHEKGRKFYELQFEKKDPVTKKTVASFRLLPDVYMMKDNNMSSNPDTKSYLDKDIFTYVSYALGEDKNVDTSQFKTIELSEGGIAFYSNGTITLNKVVKNPVNERYRFNPSDAALMADITLLPRTVCIIKPFH